LVLCFKKSTKEIHEHFIIKKIDANYKEQDKNFNNSPKNHPMKTLLKILIPLTLLLFTACQKEDLQPTTANIRQSIQEKQPNTHAIPHRKTMITRTYTEAFKILPIKTDEDLLTLAADCQDRENIASKYKMTLEQLTIATEIADLKRLGISTDLAATIHATTFVGIVDIISGKTDFIGITDLIGGKHQTLDIGLLSKMPVEPFYKLIKDFIEDQCTDCANTPTPTFESISYLINSAKHLPVLLSYEKEGICSSIDPKKTIKESGYKAINFDHIVLPKSLTESKPMIIRTYTESFEILPIQTDEALLALTADCKDRTNIAQQYNLDYQELTTTTEIADLKRIGITTEQAAILLATVQHAQINNQLNFIGIVDIVSGRAQTLDVGLLATLQPNAFHGLITEFVKKENIFFQNIEGPTIHQIKEWIKVAVSLSPMISYQ